MHIAVCPPSVTSNVTYIEVSDASARGRYRDLRPRRQLFVFSTLVLLPLRLTQRVTRAVLGAIDVHTHVYLPRYLQVLRERSTVPKILQRAGQDRIVILPGVDAVDCASSPSLS